jgi:hypothetical protein
VDTGQQDRSAESGSPDRCLPPCLLIGRSIVADRPTRDVHDDELYVAR